MHHEALLEIKNVSIEYPVAIGVVRAVEGLSLELYPQEILGVVGESGCGKSTLGLSILRLLRSPGRVSEGEILYKGQDILKLKQKELLGLRGRKVAMIFQNPLTSLNPVYTIERHFEETLRIHERTISKVEMQQRIKAILKALNIEESRLNEYPFQLSGGMRQRIMIGLGLILNPDIVIADEPTTALDVIVEAGFIDLLIALKRDFGLSVMLVSHNIGLVAEIADRIAVMYGGKIVEQATSKDLFSTPLHPYTRGLLACVPNIAADDQDLVAMPGSPPDLVSPPSGCRFSPRCPHAIPVCHELLPSLRAVGSPQHLAACWLYAGKEEGGLGLHAGDALPPGTLLSPELEVHA